MEDGEAIEIIQRATRAERAGQTTVIEMGGRGPVHDQAHRATEAPVRGFWSYWAELMGVSAPGGIQ
jgi:sugar phosphate isomerase/epimerase